MWELEGPTPTENSSNAETYALTAPGYAPLHAEPDAGSWRSADRHPRDTPDAPDRRSGASDATRARGRYCSTGWGASLLSWAWMTGESCSVATSILRGFAFSLTGIVTFSTPLL